MHDEHNPSLTLFQKTNSWYCFSCGIGGDVIDLVAKYFKTDRVEACNWLEVEYNMKPKPYGWKWEKRAKPISIPKQEESKITVESMVDSCTDRLSRFKDDSTPKLKNQMDAVWMSPI